MAQKMSAAVAAEDWNMLAAMNTLMTTTLPQMAAHGPWNAGERAALSALRQIHDEAVKRCDRAAEDLGRRMNEMQANQEGWLAYALYSDQADNGINA
jgi:hypothetical protein